MSDNQPPPFDASGLLEPGKSNVQLIYILYLVGLLIGITPLIGVVLAYLNRGKADEICENHYTWIIRTFWIGLLYGFISLLLTFLVVGIFLMIATAVWIVVRCVVGLQKINRNEPLTNPQGWLI